VETLISLFQFVEQVTKERFVLLVRIHAFMLDILSVDSAKVKFIKFFNLQDAGRLCYLR